MRLDELLARVRQADIALRADGDALRVRGPRDALTPELRAALEDHKPTVLAWARDPAALDAARARLPDPTQPLRRPIYELVPESFARVASAQPDAPAIARGDRTWTYRELDRAARAVMGQLAQREVARGHVVGVRGESSFELVASLLGVLRLGAVILPLDPALPQARQQVMLDAAGASLVIDAAPIDDREPCPGAQAADGKLGRARAGMIDAPLFGDDPAYVFFTSGTTGVPKGVVGTHAGLGHFLAWQRTTFAVDARDRCAQLTALSFDVVLRAIFLPLTSGACLCLPARPDDAAPASVWTFMADQRVTLVHAVPALAQHWLTGVAEAARMPALTRTFFAGEPLTDDLVRRWRAALGPACEVINLYGPTETTLAKCCYRVPDEPSPGIQPVGLPLPQTQALVLDEARRLCDVGEAGEVYLRTPFRTRGYLNAPAAQAERFVVNPFTNDATDLLYRTGDRGRYRLDGLLELLGRVDDQVKIHGTRVEPAEVNAALAGHPAITACFTAAHRVADDHRLVAYYVARAPAPTALALRSYLASQLPAAMVPAAFVALDQLPLTANGKVDRGALPDPATAPAAAYVAPRTPTEATLHQIWCEVIALERASVDDDFFAVGGHSLLANQVLARIRQRTGVALALRDVFEAPTIAQLAARVDLAAPDRAIPLVATERAAPLALSYAQERLWFLHELEPAATGYGLCNAVRVHSAIDRDALAAALRDVALRHDSLRTTFAVHDGLPHAQIHDALELPLELLDLRAQPDATARALEHIRLAAERPFDLARGPLARASLIRLADDDHVIAIQLHHIIADGWSLGVLVDDLTAAYQARTRGAPRLPALPIQYADYVAWQRARTRELDRQVERVVARLAGVPEVLELPTDHPRPAVQRFVGATAERWLEPPLVAGVDALAARAQATPAIALLALFGALLYRHSGQADFAIGMPIANRPELALEPLIGMFANTVVVRLQPAGALSSFLARVRDEALAAYAEQDAPFEKVVERLQPARDLRRNPVFQVMYAYQNLPARRDALRAEPFEIPSRAARFDLELRVVEDGGRLRLLLDYASDLFDAATADRMLRRYLALIAHAIAAPDADIDDLALLDRDEERDALETWNATARPYPDASFPALFAAQVARRPDAIAAADATTALTYRALGDRVDRIAAQLARAGVGPHALVPIIGPRSTAFLAAIIGVLRAGAAYVPIDPAYPAARIQRILAHTGAHLAICADDARAALPPDLVVHDLATLGERDLDLNTQDTAPPAPPHALTYVIFTSGSTGQPKGAMVESRGMVNHLFTKVEDLGLTADDVLVQNASQCFDISVWQFLAPLVVGGRVEIVSDDVALDPARLAARVAAAHVTVLEVVPSMLRELVAVPRIAEACGALRWLVATGEALPPELCLQWHARVPCVPILNAYGPTECSDDTHTYRVEPRALALGTTVSIGRPVGNLRGYVLDRALRPCPLGVVGELYIGGVGVGRGYLADPRLTAQVFLPDPFAREPGARLYRTRDLAVLRGDGRVEFHGRVDDQVKVRGFRIELGEVEVALAALPGVAAAAAAVRVDASGHSQLVAFVITENDADDDALRTAAATQLPDYLVPSRFVRVAALPRNANGKLDRKALAAIELPTLEAADPIAPRTETEARIAAIWCQVLDLATVSVTDHFFRIGGHSLSASRVAARVRDAFGIELALRTVFEHPTIESLAAAVELAEIAAATDAAELFDELAALSEDEIQHRLARRRR